MSTVSLTIAGTEYIDVVVIESLRFESMVNGSVGIGVARLRDDLRTFSFTQGAEGILTVDGDVAWRGFLQASKRVYIFPVVDTDPALVGLQRFWDLEFSDVNVLFQKRFVFNQDTPATVGTFDFPNHTADTTALAELYANWLDLSGDGINTETVANGGLVENVGDINVDQPGNPFYAGDSWGTAVQAVSAIPGAIDYINPDKFYVHTDVDTPNAPFDLSDQPNYSTTFGYREMEILRDGSSLGNDALEWGIGYGSQTPVFKRHQDAASIAEHGTWQVGTLNSGVYKQATINRIAQSFVEGSPLNKRGARDDKVSVQCVTYQPGLRVAQKVHFYSEVFGFDDVIPVRRMVITFINPTTPKYQLVLSHDIDAPYMLVNQYLLEYLLPPVVIPTGPPLPHPEGCICGITDSFDRTVVPNNLTGGVSDWGQTWSVTNWFDSTDTVEVDSGVMTTSVTNRIELDLPIATLSEGQTWDVVWGIRFNDPQVTCRMQMILGGLVDLRVFRYFESPSTVNIVISAGSGSDVDFDFEFIEGTWYNFSLHHTGLSGDVALEWWEDGGTHYPLTGPLIANGMDAGTSASDISIETREFVEPSGSISFRTMDLTGSNRCDAVQFDDFERTVTGGWGSATPSGAQWTIDDDSGGFVYIHVDGHAGVFDTNASPSIDYSGGTSALIGHALTVPWEATFSFQHDEVDWSILSNTYSHCYLRLSPEPLAGGVPFIEVHQQAFGANVLGHPAGRTFFGLRAVDADLNACGNITNGYIDLPSGGTINYRLRVESDNMRLKAWEAGSAEPDTWTVVASSAVCGNAVIETVGALLGSPFVSIAVASVYGNTDVYRQGVDFIDFDYASRPCYVDYTPCLFEPWTDPVDWFFTDNLQDFTTYPTYNAAPHQPIVSLTHVDGFLTAAKTEGALVIDLGGGSYGGALTFGNTQADKAVTGSGANGGLLGVGAVSAAFDFSGTAVDSDFTNDYAENQVQLFIDIIDDSHASSATVLLFHGDVSGNFVGNNDKDHVRILTSGHSPTDYVIDRISSGTINIAFIAGEWRIQIASVYHTASNTLVGPVEVDGVMAYAGIAAVGFDPSAAPPTYAYEAILETRVGEMMFTSDGGPNSFCGTVAPGPGSPPSGPGGFGCEVAERLTSSTYATSVSYTRGTPVVYINGILQTRGVAWDESPTNDRYINFSTGQSADTVVTICYSPLTT